MMEEGVAIDAMLVICPECQTPAMFINGVAEAALLTFWTRNGLPMFTPHAEDCEYRGKALP